MSLGGFLRILMINHFKKHTRPRLAGPSAKVCSRELLEQIFAVGGLMPKVWPSEWEIQSDRNHKGLSVEGSLTFILHQPTHSPRLCFLFC